MPRQKTHLALQMMMHFNKETGAYESLGANYVDHPACNYHGWFPDMTTDLKRVTCKKCKKAIGK